MKINEQIEMLVLTLKMGEHDFVINPVAIRDEQSYVLVDTGMPGSFGQITELLIQAGIDPAASHSIILTHQDIDHVGSLPQFKGEGIEVYAHADDQPYIDGLKPMIKFSGERKEGLIASLPQDLATAFEATFSGKEKNVTTLLADGEKLPFGGGLTVIHTPGHTPGHISLYHEPSKTLIAGDALNVEDDKLIGPNPTVTPDMTLALESLRKLKAYPIETVICYHGGIFKGDVQQALDKITENL
ncbi:MBL fold metallo-hydrolase [Paenibacillus tundrae]|uniref:MBL fold metallo-hydrolase n=1 Tax=Paenibacillus tundrae TaxID=528187 RepID=UPI0022A948D5|nr:MBL fold metallo-hydrolase [Paenibacillus tundrae]MCZ1265049.1 MBL fold metallo-hydrolase [Paenibacillus tundrae]